MFGKKKKSDSMSPEELKKLNSRGLKYVTERDSETYKENRLGNEGAINIVDGEFILVCGGINVMRCDIDKVKAGELMNLSGLTIRGFDKESGKERSVIAYYSDGSLSLSKR